MKRNLFQIFKFRINSIKEKLIKYYKKYKFLCIIVIILNKIYFDNKSESIKNNTSDKYFQTLGMIAIMNFKIDENNDAFLPNDPTSLGKIGQSNKNTITSQESLFTTKNKLFSDFDKFKDYYENSKENWTSNIDISEIFKNMDEIKTLYNQKVEENNAILNSYTRNTKEQFF